jgi:hypothetical protein
MKYNSYEQIHILAHSIYGLTDRTQGEWIFDLIKRLPDDSFICEVGTNHGRMTSVMALSCLDTNRRVVTIDWMVGNYCERGIDERKNIYLEVIDSFIRLGIWEKIIPLPMSSVNIFTNEPFDIEQMVETKVISAIDLLFSFNRFFDLIYLDGDHSYEIVLKELQLFTKLLPINGVVCGDDMETQNIPFIPFIEAWPHIDKFRNVEGNVVQAVFEFFKDNPEFEPQYAPGNQFAFKKVI